MAEAAMERDFNWRGRDARGQRHSGVVRAASAEAARAELQRRGLKVERLRAGGGRGKRIKSADIALFARQLSVMVNAGVPLVQGLSIIAEGFDNPRMRHIIGQVRQEIEGGSPLSTSLGHHPAQFDPLFCNLVAVGEQTGRLDNLLERIADTRERLEAIKAKVRKALTYPSVVLVVALAITAMMLTVVIPAFKGLFAGFGADLPAITQAVIGLSEWTQRWGLLILLALVGGAVGAFQAHRRSAAFRRRVASTLLRTPILGPILRKAAISRYARTQATLFDAGIPLVEGMDSVAGAMGNPVYADAIVAIRDQVATGQSLQQALNSSDLFPNMVIQMVSIGEETGELDSMLSKVADFYEAEVSDAVDNLSSLMEPIVMVVLGGLIGGLVVAMYLPVFQMGQAVS